MDRVAAGVRATYDSGRTRSVAWRLRQLQAMRRMIQDNRDEWIAAVMASTLRPHAEAVLGDVMVTQQEIDFMIANVATWAAPHEVSTPLPLIPASSRIEPQPFGVTLIIGPSNYPMMLVLCPLAGALAAGNAAVLKPSELCPEVSDLMASLVKAYLDDAVQVVLGDEVVVRDLLDQRWDHIMFTGSERVGKVVAAAAARHLTPTTLELGGKCPVVVDHTAEPLASIAYKLAWGRLFNGGQSCVAPEYVLVPRESTGALVEQLAWIIQRVHGDDPQRSAHFGRVSSCAAAKRIGSLLVGHGGTVAFGGTVDVAQRYVAPTVIVDPREDAAVMCEESFGPVLCIISVDSLDDAIAYVRRRPGTPLTLYGFTSDPAVERRLLDEIPSGNAMFNGACMRARAQRLVNALPSLHAPSPVRQPPILPTGLRERMRRCDRALCESALAIWWPWLVRPRDAPRQEVLRRMRAAAQYHDKVHLARLSVARRAGCPTHAAVLTALHQFARVGPHPLPRRAARPLRLQGGARAPCARHSWCAACHRRAPRLAARRGQRLA